MKSNSTTLWAIIPDALTAREQLRESLSSITRADTSARPDRDWLGNELPKTRMVGSTAVVPVRGVMLNNATSFDRFLGDTGYEDVIEDAKAAIAAGARAIVFDIDSPGGTVAGAQETNRRLRQACAGVESFAFTSGMATSAAYWLANSCSHIAATPSADVGSVGAVVSFLTYERALDQAGISAHIIASDDLKTVGNPMREPSAQHIVALQERIDEAANTFKRAVLESRPGIALESLDARVVSGARAINLGMIDSVEESLESFLNTINS